MQMVVLMLQRKKNIEPKEILNKELWIITKPAVS